MPDIENILNIKLLNSQNRENISWGYWLTKKTGKRYIVRRFATCEGFTIDEFCVFRSQKIKGIECVSSEKIWYFSNYQDADTKFNILALLTSANLEVRRILAGG